jgi:hypothetical protein
MGTINKQTHVTAEAQPRTHEGAVAKRITPEQELRRSVLACLLWEDTFYESGESVADRITAKVAEVDPGIVRALAIEARSDFHLRHVPLLLCDALAKQGDLDATTLAAVIQRPDELTEFLAIYWRDGKTPLAGQVKKGLARAFTKFNAYSLAKYNRDNAIKLRDVMFLCHPEPKDAEQAALWKLLADKKPLPTPDTWETALSGGGDKLEEWTRLLTERKLGGLALLRNLRNMDKANVNRRLLVESIREGNYSRVLPFRFLSAAKHAPTLEPVLEEVMFKALEGSKKLPGKTILLVDNSGSMTWNLTGKGELNRTEAAAALAILLREICDDVEVISFAFHPTLLPPRRGFALRDVIFDSPSGGTYTEKAKQFADTRGYDRLIILTDEQSHQTLSNPKGEGYVINVAPYQRGVGYGAWNHIDGWSEAVVRYIQELETL